MADTQNPSPVSLAAYWDMLEQHDWWHEMSDDGGMFRKGRRERDKLTEISRQSSEHRALFNDYRRHMFNGPPWGTPEVPKPQRPK